MARLLRGPWRGDSSDFDLAPDIRTALPPGRKLKPAAVLIALVERDDGPHVLLTRRSRRLKAHPGQIAFPGGRVDAGDASSWHAALREAQEEIGLEPALVAPLGAMPRHETVTGFDVEPHVGRVAPGFSVRAAEAEVAEVFEVPLAFLLDPVNYQVHERDWNGRRRRYYAVPWGPYYIWGATARILKALSDRVQAG
ncbi:CoA pyrophosphatase [Rhodobacteraceae bacterium 2CG4]|uniref:CoA pyrophosphatase n=1 Tax=Halovulum marinum TaxID=2662447 RepID=A0A6L5Z0B1_9RHOB|nr:CoA pyrophosphatase [Halovulum marinum]MSU89535.1 CoA pyrophosphatase [Halovulum marinum]